MQTQNQQKHVINQPFFKTSTSATSYFLNFNNGNGNNSRTPSQVSVASPPTPLQQQQHINVRPLNSQGDTFFRPATPARQMQRERGKLRALRVNCCCYFKQILPLKNLKCQVRVRGGSVDKSLMFFQTMVHDISLSFWLAICFFKW